MRVIDLTYTHDDELVRILADAGTPPTDRRFVMRALRLLDEAHDPRTMLRDMVEVPGLLEYVIEARSSGHLYGVLLVDMGPVADTVAYWRTPPLYVDPSEPLPHGYSRAHGLERARRRMRGNQ
jgi:hypothetical protein